MKANKIKQIFVKSLQHQHTTLKFQKFELIFLNYLHKTSKIKTSQLQQLAIHLFIIPIYLLTSKTTSEALYLGQSSYDFPEMLSYIYIPHNFPDLLYTAVRLKILLSDEYSNGLKVTSTVMD